MEAMTPKLSPKGRARAAISGTGSYTNKGGEIPGSVPEAKRDF